MQLLPYMKKILYIIPGWKESCRRKPYQLLATLAKKKDYEVIFYNVRWRQLLSPQAFPVSKNAVVFGFSLGAVLAWLVAQDSPCRHVILASMPPLHSLKRGKDKKAFVDLLGRQYVENITRNLKPKHLAKKQTQMYGDLEEEQGDILVLNTGHELNGRYIKEIAKIL